MILFTKKNFKEMLWSNGRGKTLELYSLQTPFVFRLSVATVEQNGPFSIYPMIDRTLILIDGDGFILNDKLLNKQFSPISFQGEEKIDCSLINGTCKDFNVMVDRRWGRCITQVITRESDIIITADNKLKFIFDFDTYQLWQIEKDDQLYFEKNLNTSIITVEVYAN